MNDDQVGIVVKYVAANWPNARMTDDTLTVWALELAVLDFDVTLDVLRHECAGAEFAPPPMRLRALVEQRVMPAAVWEQLLDELMSKVASDGYTSPEPAWSHPALAAFVAQRGGWVVVCQSTPARDALGPAGVSVFNTWQAQARDALRPLIVAAAADRPARPALEVAALGELEAALGHIGRER